MLIDLTRRDWYLHLHALHTFWCDVVVALWHPCARVRACRPLVGAMSVVESPDSCREGAGSIPAALMAPPPKRRRRSCCERLTEQVPERTAAGGGGGDFLPGLGGGRQDCRDQKDDRAHLVQAGGTGGGASY